ncbi:MAG: hypoxanthine phosphoribosyltransferase [Candidatus Hydrogenedentes bacterium]|nr:hypoxanthine phosphoribosyltransferase [Candidatus Hydrogenedentota bacterium]
MRLSDTPLIAADAIQRRVAELARLVDVDLAGPELVAVVVLKGAVIFAADLVRHLATPTRLEFVRARSYQGTESAGPVELTAHTAPPVTGRNVLVIEDILDTGRTTAAILEQLRAQQPARLALCALLDKPARRTVDIEADYVGFTIEDRFVVGYGLDYDEQFRHLPAVHVLEDA